MEEIIKGLKDYIDQIANGNRNYIMIPSDLDKESISLLHKYCASKANDTRDTRDIYGWSEDERYQHYIYLGFMNNFKGMLENVDER